MEVLGRSVNVSFKTVLIALSAVAAVLRSSFLMKSSMPLANLALRASANGMSMACAPASHTWVS